MKYQILTGNDTTVRERCVLATASRVERNFVLSPLPLVDGKKGLVIKYKVAASSAVARPLFVSGPRDVTMRPDMKYQSLIMERGNCGMRHVLLALLGCVWNGFGCTG